MRQFLVVALLLGLVSASPAQEASAPQKRVIILGIDGVDYRLMNQYIDEGRLPNFRKLRDAGGFFPLTTSMPPQSPVAWSNFITGQNSGGHGIFDFLHRNPNNYIPFASTAEVKAAQGGARFLGIPLPDALPLPFSDYIMPLGSATTENLRHGKAFWEILEDHGVECVINRIPANFPPIGGGAVTLSGMGTPDIQGTNGTYSFYTNNPPPDYKAATGGKIFVTDVVDGVAKSKLYGPPNDFIDYDSVQRRTGRRVAYQDKKASIPFEVYVDAENAVAKLLIDEHEIFLEEGVITPWYEVTFSLLPTPPGVGWAWHNVVSVKGLVRFCLTSAHPDFGLYISPVQISPVHPAVPISTPPEYAADLAKAVGPYYTQGMPQDTRALEMDIFGNAGYAQQLDIILEEEMRIAEYELQRFEKGVLFLYWTAIDQTGHVMWRTLAGQEDHPAYEAALDDPFKDYYPTLYTRFDDYIGKVMRDYVDDNTYLIIMSDHGFASWKRAFDLNRWLYDNGYLALQPGVAPSSVEFLAGVDWNNTKLYSIGINGLYVNQIGREKHGIVPPGPATDELIARVVTELEAVVDPTTNVHPVSKAYVSKEIYSGPYLDIGPDIVVGYRRGYRASDESAAGEVSSAVLSDNTRRWSGDHCQDYRELPGVLFTNFPVRKPDPALVDLAPTLLKIYGIDPTPEMIGRPVF